MYICAIGKSDNNIRHIPINHIHGQGRIGEMNDLNCRLKILFLCTGNSCRSQMAEALTGKLKADKIEAFSAGVSPKAIDPLAVRAMSEIGIDISNNKSKDIDDLEDIEFDYVITLCDNARESCPIFPGAAVTIHHGFDDPPLLAENAKSEEEAMFHYRKIRDEIKAFVETLPLESMRRCAK